MLIKKLAIFLAVLLFTGCGAAACSLAGGIKWGTEFCGFIAYVAFLFGSVAGAIAASEYGS